MTGKKTNFISFLFPVFNSEKTISILVDLLVKELKQKCNFEIILVNDCSTDQSEEVCQSRYNKYKKMVRVFSLAENVGEHNAVMAGLNQARGDFAVIMDDDFQNPVSDAVRLIQTCLLYTSDAADD